MLGVPPKLAGRVRLLEAGDTPARLPKAGSLSNLSVGTRVTSLGYEAQSVTIDQAQHSTTPMSGMSPRAGWKR
ncbi:MAG: hypothetical protein ACM3ML_20530 [Micromonosporaceae bacterium]